MTLQLRYQGSSAGLALMLQLIVYNVSNVSFILLIPISDILQLFERVEQRGLYQYIQSVCSNHHHYMYIHVERPLQELGTHVYRSSAKFLRC